MFPFYRRGHDDSLFFHTMRITSELWGANYPTFVLSMSVTVFESNIDGSGSVPRNDTHF